MQHAWPRVNAPGPTVQRVGRESNANRRATIGKVNSYAKRIGVLPYFFAPRETQLLGEWHPKRMLDLAAAVIPAAEETGRYMQR